MKHLKDDKTCNILIMSDTYQQTIGYIVIFSFISNGIVIYPMMKGIYIPFKKLKA